MSSPASPTRAAGRAVALGVALAVVMALAAGPARVAVAAPSVGLLPASLSGGSALVGGPSLGGTWTRADVNLHRSGAMVTQLTNTWCVPANTQSMLNLILGTDDRTWNTQEALYAEIRGLNLYAYATAGNDVHGWASALNARLGDGVFGVRMFSTFDAAVDAIVDSIERTGWPVGIAVDRGTHAWTVLGYRADERRSADGVRHRTVLGLYVSGSLGPGSSDPWPFRYQDLATFARRYTRYHEWQKPVIWEDQFVIVAG